MFDFDHVHFDSSTASPIAILYGALGTDCFKEFHVTLVQAAKEVYYLFCTRFLIVLFINFRVLFLHEIVCSLLQNSWTCTFLWEVNHDLSYQPSNGI